MRSVRFNRIIILLPGYRARSTRIPAATTLNDQPQEDRPVRATVILAASALLLAPPATRAADEKGNLTQAAIPTSLLAPQAQVAVASLVCFLEGPAVDAAGNLFFSDITTDRVVKL